MAVTAPESRFDRNIRLFGHEGQEKLRATHAVVTGTSGLGSPLVQHLALLGVGAITAIDDETLDDSNRNRFVGARADDPVGMAKVEIVCRLVHEIDPSIKVDAIHKGLASPEAFDAIKRGDWVFGCFDHDGPRALLNELCQAYSKPYSDLASDVPESGVFGGRAFTSIGGDGCLHCLGVLDADQVQDYFAGAEERKRRDDSYGVAQEVLEQKGPSVSPINGVVASLAAVEFMVAVTGMRAPRRHVDYRGDRGRVGNVTDQAPGGCFYCAKSYGRGEAANVERVLSNSSLR
jgi:molybdopterin/thiamine biosynthesis adenylyltransferase